tara:strand:+ start:715 stop:1542 length:828 start_codon:yes stop_codon:yes gene_type:complete
MASFVKMHGLGNDFVVIDQRKETEGTHWISADQIRLISDRRRGVGCDQVVFIYPARSFEASARLRFFNADGSESDACGNASRCVASHLMTLSNNSEVTLETNNSILHATLKPDNLVTIDMGSPKLEWTDIPISEPCDTLHLPVLEGELSDPVGVSMGNPHCIFIVEDAEKVNLTEAGPKIENNALFPARTNVGVVSKLSASSFRLRVWERGAGVTESCGTGACAAAVAIHRREIGGREVMIEMDGGQLRIYWRKEDDHVLLTGPVETSFIGELKL